MIEMPLDLSANQSALTIFFVVSAVYFVAAVGWAVAKVRDLGALPLLLILGGLVAALQESLIDRMILLWYPTDSPAIAYTAMGVPQPLYMFLIYGGFVGMGSYVSYVLLRRSRQGHTLWTVFLSVLVMDMLFEIPATAAGVYAYYGPQPMQFFDQGWPIWVGFLAAAPPALAGWALYKLFPLLRGRQRLLLIGLPPLAWILVYFGAGWPAFITIGSAAPAVLRGGGAALTMALTVLLVAVLTRYVTPDPEQHAPLRTTGFPAGR